MEGSGFGGFPFGGDPEDLLRGLREFAEQQAESVQEAQREQFATLTLNTAVELTAAAPTASVAFMPRAAWPGTGHQSAVLPFFSVTMSVALFPGWISGVRFVAVPTLTASACG